MNTQNDDSDADDVINEHAAKPRTPSMTYFDRLLAESEKAKNTQESKHTTTLTLVEHQRAVLHALLSLADQIDRFFAAAKDNEGEVDASFLHDAETLRRVLATYGPLLSCSTPMTRELIARQAASL